MDAARVPRCPICREPSGIDERDVPTFECARGHSWWQPWAGPQTRFLSLTCFEAGYGGAAGSGKSDAILIDAVRYVGRGYGANYHALLLRRTYPELEKSLIKRSKQLYPRLGGKYNKVDHVWTFPGGEIVEFGHAQHEDDVHQYQGAAFQYVAFDELTSFTEYQYLYLFSRCRSSIGIKCRIRSTCNPGGEGHAWVFARFAPWLDTRPEYDGVRAKPGEVLRILRKGDTERLVEKDTPGAKGRTFVPATLKDNPSLHADGEYEAGLQQLDRVTRAQLLDGDWLIKPAAGLYFKRAYFKFVERNLVPHEADRVRYWDRAATEPSASNKDPDWTVGVRMARSRDKLLWVEDVVRFRGNPGTVQATLKATAQLDAKDGVVQCLEQDPGQAGKVEIDYLIKELQGFDVRACLKRVNKIVAAGPISAQSEAGNVRFVIAPWNNAFVEEIEDFPDGPHDDQADAFGGAFSQLVDPAPSMEDLDRFAKMQKPLRFTSRSSADDWDD